MAGLRKGIRKSHKAFAKRVCKQMIGNAKGKAAKKFYNYCVRVEVAKQKATNYGRSGNYKRARPYKG